MHTYDIKYTSNSDAIPAGATKLQKQLDNIGTIYLVHHNDKTDIYLDYSIGIKIEKPTILRIEEENNNVSIDIRRPDKGVKNKISYHTFKIEFNKKIDSVHLMEFI